MAHCHTVDAKYEARSASTTPLGQTYLFVSSHTAASSNLLLTRVPIASIPRAMHIRVLLLLFLLITVGMHSQFNNIRGIDALASGLPLQIMVSLFSDSLVSVSSTPNIPTKFHLLPAEAKSFEADLLEGD